MYLKENWLTNLIGAVLLSALYLTPVLSHSLLNAMYGCMPVHSHYYQYTCRG